MSYAAPIVPLIESPINLDAVIQHIQKALGSRLDWLSHSFGKAVPGYEVLADGSGRNRVYPSAYAGAGQYQDVGPNNHYQAQSFLQVSGAEKPTEYDKFSQNEYKANLELVFLFDLDRIKQSLNLAYKHRFTEELKDDIRKILVKLAPVDSVDAIYENPSDVLRGYSHNETERQSFKHPYGGLKFAITVRYLENCIL